MVVLGGDALTATLVCLAVGMAVGLINGLIIVYMRVPDLLATLGMMFLLLGLQRIPTEGRSIAAGMTLPDGSTATGAFSPAFLALGRHRFDLILPNLLPVSVVVLIVLAIVGGLFVAEALSVIIQVAVYKRTGKRVFKMAPIHHHFEQLGWSESKVVIRFWIIAIVLALIGLSTLKLW